MTLSHEDANARLIDLVYGEGTPDARAALEAHVAGCAQCTADLAALGATRARVRAALNEDGQAPVPPRVRANLLAAAREAVAASPGVAKASVALAAAPAKAATPTPSFWDRLRLKWTLPTFATVGAVAVVVLASKIFLEPQRTMERGKELVTAPPPAVTAPLEREQKNEERAAEAPADAPAAGTLGDHIARLRAKKAGAPSGLGTLGVTGGAGAHGLEGLGSWGRGAGAERPKPAPAANAARLKASTDDLLEGVGGGSRDEGSANDRRRPARPPADDQAASREGYAPPPTGWKGAAAGRARAAKPELADKDLAPAARAEAPGKAAMPAPRVAAAPPPGAAPAAPRAEQPAPEAAGSLAKKNAAPPPAASAAAVATRADEAEKERKQDGAPAQATLARRADQLFAARRWSEAITAYRELLRRWPKADLETRWRDRLTQCESALSAAKQAAPAAQ